MGNIAQGCGREGNTHVAWGKAECYICLETTCISASFTDHQTLVQALFPGL